MGQENGGHQSARVGVLFVGIFARLVAGLSSSNLKLRRSDYVSPMHSTPKLRECYYLMQHNMSAYEGEACHHNPLSIFLVHTFGKALNHPVYGDFSFLVLFILLDVLSGYLLFSFGNHIVGTVKRGERREDATDGGGFIFHNELSKLSAGFKAILPTVMFAVALLHPYAILSCGALSTGGVSRFLLVCALNSVGVKNHLLAVLFGALAAFQDLSVLTVLLPLFICLAKEKVADDDGVRRGRGGEGGRRVGGEVVQINWSALVSTIFATGCLFFVFSYVFSLLLWERQDDRVHSAAFLWRLSFGDNAPNAGLCWYFFAEVFDRFKQYFVFAFNAFPFTLVIPLCIYFLDRPLTLISCMLVITSIVTPYTNFSDLVLPAALFPACSNSKHGLQLYFVSFIGICVTSIMVPVMSHKWLVAGSANANYLYNQNLAFCMLHLILVSRTAFTKDRSSSLPEKEKSD